MLRNETERKEGLGQNVILSKFNKKAIGVFTKNYEKYKGGTYLKRYEPSKVIVKILNKLQK